MATGLMTSIPISGIFLGTVVLILVACEVGFLLGRNHHRAQPDEEAPTSIGPMVGGLLSMLAFVLALTFSMALGQYQTRKQNVIDEAAAIHKTYLLADLLKTSQKTEIKRLLREYAQVRLQFAQQVHRHGVRVDELQVALTKSLAVYQSLWVQAIDAATTEPDEVSAAVAQSIIDVINLGEKRKIAAVHSQIPESLWAGLLAITFLSMVTLGLHVGFNGRRRLIAVTPLAVAFAVLVTLVVDLDRPQSGFITVNQSAMVEVQAAMEN